MRSLPCDIGIGKNMNKANAGKHKNEDTLNNQQTKAEQTLTRYFSMTVALLVEDRIKWWWWHAASNSLQMSSIYSYSASKKKKLRRGHYANYNMFCLDKTLIILAFFLELEFSTARSKPFLRIVSNSTNRWYSQNLERNPTQFKIIVSFFTYVVWFSY